MGILFLAPCLTGSKEKAGERRKNGGVGGDASNMAPEIKFPAFSQDHALFEHKTFENRNIMEIIKQFVVSI